MQQPVSPVAALGTNFLELHCGGNTEGEDCHATT